MQGFWYLIRKTNSEFSAPKFLLDLLLKVSEVPNRNISELTTVILGHIARYNWVGWPKEFHKSLLYLCRFLLPDVPEWPAQAQLYLYHYNTVPVISVVHNQKLPKLLVYFWAMIFTHILRGQYYICIKYIYILVGNLRF